jgi:hypothetical protein
LFPFCNIADGSLELPYQEIYQNNYDVDSAAASVSNK